MRQSSDFTREKLRAGSRDDDLRIFGSDVSEGSNDKLGLFWPPVRRGWHNSTRPLHLARTQKLARTTAICHPRVRRAVHSPARDCPRGRRTRKSDRSWCSSCIRRSTDGSTLTDLQLSLIHISEPTRLLSTSYA